MNEVSRRLGGSPGLAVLSFPVNQLGLQEDAKNKRILNSLKYVRAGDGFYPDFPPCEKCPVNDAQAHLLLAFLREVQRRRLMTHPKLVTLLPMCNHDVAWNFEKFLVGPDGVLMLGSVAAIDVEPAQRPCCPGDPAVPTAPQS